MAALILAGNMAMSSACQTKTSYAPGCGNEESDSPKHFKPSRHVHQQPWIEKDSWDHLDQIFFHWDEKSTCRTQKHAANAYWAYSCQVVNRGTPSTADGRIYLNKSGHMLYCWQNVAGDNRPCQT